MKRNGEASEMLHFLLKSHGPLAESGGNSIVVALVIKHFTCDRH